MGGAKVKYKAPFFRWLNIQILMIEYYAYAAMEFWGDLDLPLPASAQWGDIGKKILKILIIFVFSSFMIFIDDNKT